MVSCWPKRRLQQVWHDFPGTAAYRPSALTIQPCTGWIDLHHASTCLFCQRWDACRRLHQARGSNGEQQVALLGGFKCLAQLPDRQVFPEPDNAGADKAAANTNRWTRSAASFGFHRDAGRQNVGLATSGAARRMQTTVEMQHIGTTSALMQIVHVLRDDGEFRHQRRQGCNGNVGRVCWRHRTCPRNGWSIASAWVAARRFWSTWGATCIEG